MGDTIKETVIMNAISLAIALVSLGLALWTAVSSRFRGGIDDLFLVLAGVLLALLFSIQPVLMLKRSGVFERLRARAKRPAPEPASSVAEEEKATVK